jgi:IclR family acetate operon transcriptional repressor
MGKAILATLKDEDLLAMFPNSRLAKRTPQTVKTRAELLSELQKTRERGYATNIEESEIGLGSVAAAIIDRHGTTQAALSVAAPIGRFTASTIPRLVKAAQQAAKAIGSQL